MEPQKIWQYVSKRKWFFRWGGQTEAGRLQPALGWVGYLWGIGGLSKIQMHSRGILLFVLLFFMSCNGLLILGPTSKISVFCSRPRSLDWCLNIRESKWWTLLQASVLDTVIIQWNCAAACLPAPAEARCQGFSVSDGTAGWQTSGTWCSGRDQGSSSSRRRRGGGVAGTSKSVLRSAGVLGYVTVILL